MKTILLNFIPKTRNGENHCVDHSVAKLLQEELDMRINRERPALESSIANQLAETESFEVSEEPGANGADSDLLYIQKVVEQLDIDNLMKGQILERF